MYFYYACIVSFFIFERMKKETFDYALRSAWNGVSKMYNKEASFFESTMSMGFALLSIDAAGTPSTTLGPKMGMEPTSLSRLLNNMEQRNLIYRSQHPQDKRSVLIHLTPFGKEMREDSKAVVLAFNDTIQNQLEAIEIKHFYKVIDCIRETAKTFAHIENKLQTNPKT